MRLPEQAATLPKSGKHLGNARAACFVDADCERLRPDMLNKKDALARAFKARAIGLNGR
jgi:hypothetical protein